MRPKNKQLHRSIALLGKDTTELLLQAHEDSLWVLENVGVGCKHPEILAVFRQHESQGEAIIFEDRVYITPELVKTCLSTVPGVAEFFVPLNSFFIGGTAPYIYDDNAGQGGILPTADHVARIAQIAEIHAIVAGMGRGVKIQNEVEQMDTMAAHCSKPLYFPITSDAALSRAKQLYTERSNIIILFCLTRPVLQVNENFSDDFVKVVKTGLPVFISAMPMAGISAPYCYNGILTMTHAEVLFGICATQLLSPGTTVIHAGFPTIADPRFDYNPNYGLRSHFLLNILQTHLNLIFDIPTFQSIATTNEEHPTKRALDDARTGQAMALKFGFHMMRHPFGFLRHLVDFSFLKLDEAKKISE